MALAMSIYRTLCVLVWSAPARKILTIHRPSVRNNYNDETQKIRKSQFVLSLPWFLHFSLSILLRFCIWDNYEIGYFSFKLEEFKSDPGENKLNPPPHQTSLNQKPMFSFCKQNIWNLSAVQNSSPFSNENRFIISELAAYIPLSWVQFFVIFF